MAVPIRKREGGSGAGRRADTGDPPLQEGVEPASGRDRGAAAVHTPVFICLRRHASTLRRLPPATSAEVSSPEHLRH